MQLSPSAWELGAVKGLTDPQLERRMKPELTSQRGLWLWHFNLPMLELIRPHTTSSKAMPKSAVRFDRNAVDLRIHIKAEVAFIALESPVGPRRPSFQRCPSSAERLAAPHVWSPGLQKISPRDERWMFTGLTRMEISSPCRVPGPTREIVN